MSSISKRKGDLTSISTNPDEISPVDHPMIDDHEVKGSTAVTPLSSSDRSSILLLLLLYVLQGIPLGLAGAIPLMLQARQVEYRLQAVFSFVFWPFSVKLLWAPLVDSVYFAAFGRRKSWLVPVQYLIGFFMMFLSSRVDVLMGDEDKGKIPEVHILTALFFMMNFLAATQDVVVDGWALTMLSKENVGYASTCNTVGQTAGYFLGNVVFLALSSPDFTNKYLRSVPAKEGLVTFSGYLWFWGMVFLITTTLVWLFKKEKSEAELHGEEQVEGVVESYKILWRILKLPVVISYIIILLTVKIGFAPADVATGLKLIEAGVPKENLALLAVPMVPIQILLPWFISRYTTGPKPMDIFLKAMPLRLLLGLVFMACVWWAGVARNPTDNSYPIYFYAGILLVYAVHQVTVYCMFVAMMAFHARVSDPRVGGTYMTMLNTVSNFGGNWCQTLSLWFLDSLTWKYCLNGETSTGSCVSKDDLKACVDAGGRCHTTIDGYGIEVVVCMVIGFMWLKWKAREIKALQDKPVSNWRCL